VVEALAAKVVLVGVNAFSSIAKQQIVGCGDEFDVTSDFESGPFYQWR
jgi:hypothetical protein